MAKLKVKRRFKMEVYDESIARSRKINNNKGKHWENMVITNIFDLPMEEREFE